MKKEQIISGKIYIGLGGSPYYVKSVNDNEVYYSKYDGMNLHCSIETFCKLFQPW